MQIWLQYSTRRLDTEENKYRELDGTLHTRERCEFLKKKQENHKGNHNNEVCLEIVLKKLESIGITIDLNKLRNAK